MIHLHLGNPLGETPIESGFEYLFKAPLNTIPYFIEEDMEMCKYVVYYIVLSRELTPLPKIETEIAYTYDLELAKAFLEKHLHSLSEHETLKIFGCSGKYNEKHWRRHFCEWEIKTTKDL